jgi:hypothetical protein
MIPRLHKRGTSFKGACSYILHDAGKDTNDRVLWAEKVNLASDPEHAWFEMFATARDQALLKQQSGQDARGRKNTKPVLHYTLSWAASDNPSPEHMRETALSSLKALKLDEHQALMAAHNDKEHLHVHIVVNTIHPENGLTAPLKYTKEHLSRWAEAYEKQHGIHIEQRIRNNEARDKIQSAKQAAALLRDDPGPMPYVAVKDRPTQRDDWIDRKDILDRMKKLRAEIGPMLQPPDTSRLWQQQLQERAVLDSNSEAAVDHARSAVSNRYRPQWKELYRGHKKELRHLQRNATHPFERAVYVFRNRERLGNGKPLTLRQMAGLILKPGQLSARVSSIHEKERRTLARTEKSEKKAITERIWKDHKTKFEALRERQGLERKSLCTEHEERLRFVVTFDLAKKSLVAERQQAQETMPGQAPAPEQSPVEEFNAAVATRSPGQMAHVERIKKQMEEWRKRNPGRDFGREM